MRTSLEWKRGIQLKRQTVTSGIELMKSPSSQAGIMPLHSIRDCDTFCSGIELTVGQKFSKSARNDTFA